MSLVENHFNESHKPEAFDFGSYENVLETLSRKCHNCFLGPFETIDDLLTHIGIKHGEMVNVWVKKLTLSKTLNSLRKKCKNFLFFLLFLNYD